MSSAHRKQRRKTKKKKPFSKVFRDPVHDLIRLGPEDEFILKLIETKEFQRLRRIRQLGLCHYVYPGAEHSRFAHSLGVFNFARRMIERLKSRCDKQTGRTLDQNAQVIKAAALLHDLGHGPFSHIFERVFEKQGDEDSADHEYWTCRILIDPSTEVHQVLNSIVIDPTQVAALVADRLPLGVRGPIDPYLKDIVHSQLDADRMDYLLRDSVMTGSRFGKFDSEWILILQRRLASQKTRPAPSTPVIRPMETVVCADWPAAGSVG